MLEQRQLKIGWLTQNGLPGLLLRYFLQNRLGPNVES